MKTAKGVCLFVVLYLGAGFLNVYLYSDFGHGAGTDVFFKGVAEPWQAFIDSDLMAGLLLMVSWIIFRERGQNKLVTTVLILFLLYWGNIVVALYIYSALAQAEGDWTRFFLGARAPQGIAPAAPLPVIQKALLCLIAVAATVYAIRGLQATDFALYPAVGFCWGFLSLAAACLVYAFRDKLKPSAASIAAAA